MLFDLKILFYIISNGILTFFLIKNFERQEYNPLNNKNSLTLFLKIGLISSVFVILDIFFFSKGTMSAFLICLIYIILYRKGRILEKIYWMTVIQNATSGIYLFCQLLFYKMFHLETATEYPIFPIMSLFLGMQWVVLYEITKWFPKLVYLEKRMIVILTAINLFWLFIFDELIYASDRRISLLVCFIFLLTYTIYVLVEGLLLHHINRLIYVEMAYKNIDLKSKYDEDVEAVNLEVRKYRHDLANHLQLLSFFMEEQFYEEAREYLMQMKAEFQHINGIFFYIQTGNQAMDYILNSKRLMAQEQGIAIKIKIDDLSNLSIITFDLCTLFSNLLDNSIEACNRYTGENLFIELDLTIIKKNLAIKMKNCSNDVKTDIHGNYLTSKIKGDHGLGMKQIHKIVKKYDGYILTNYENNVFETDILLMNVINK